MLILESRTDPTVGAFLASCEHLARVCAGDIALSLDRALTRSNRCPTCPITAWAQRISFGPEDVAKLVAGFRSALAKNGLKDRTDPAISGIARLIIQIAKDGERDPAVLADRATSVMRHSYWFRCE
jgi:hypothetical protein